MLLEEPATAAAPVASLPTDRVALAIGVVDRGALGADTEKFVGAALERTIGTLAQQHAQTPFVVLSPFGTCGELFAAECAQRRGTPVVAVLAMPSEAVEARFEASLRERVRLALAACARIDVASTSDDPATARRETIGYMAGYSHLMITFTPEASRDASAVGETVALRMSGAAADDPTETQTSDVPELGPVYHIRVDLDSGDPEPPVDPAPTFPARFTGDAAFESDFSLALTRLNAFNCDLGETPPQPEKRIATIADMMDRIDAIANTLQTKSFRVLYWLYGVAVVAAAFQYTISVLMYPTIAIAYLVYRWAKRSDYENRYQDYRAVAEGLRVQQAWFGLGISARADDAYLAMQRRELLWIRIALRYLYFAFRDGALRAPDEVICREWITGQWKYFRGKPDKLRASLRTIKRRREALFLVVGVVSTVLFMYLYLPKLPESIASSLNGLADLRLPLPVSAIELHSLADSMTRLQKTWNTSALFTAPWIQAIYTWDEGKQHSTHTLNHIILVRLSTALLTLYAAIALLVTNYSEKKGFAVDVKRYERMFVVFDQVVQKLKKLKPQPAEKDLDQILDEALKLPEARKLVLDLGSAALVENADWLLVRRERPMAFVTRG